ncbi:hypothetical protein DPMN_047326 [Dreissena polymorpha]|uniref:Voltage-dependent calcium channel gamma-7 subunit n=1 Tax=Dreissena polymorpha TaxID=45954 RepID=A0A9D4I1B5_DREPO|nr:hypothetical protein DPMN_047326 [Dreissena polymorpha]
MYVKAYRWTVASLATGAAALVSLLLAVATAHWLNMREKCSFVDDEINVTAVLNLHTNAGIWKICLRLEDGTPHCTDTGITKGLDKNEEKDDSQWRTGTVLEATRIQFPFTCLAVLLTLAGFVCSIVGNFRNDNKALIAAILYILSGLCLSVCVILYISRINDELSLPNAKCVDFEYRYGWSFYLIGLAFALEETSAVISITLYMFRRSRNLSDLILIIPGLEDKLYIDIESGNGTDSNSQTIIW